MTRARVRTQGGFARAAVMALTIAAIAWGALAFGAVYPWAYVPLAGTCAAAGILALTVARRESLLLAPAVAFGCVALVVLAQEVPLSPSLLQRVSPAAHRLLAQYDLAYAAAAADQSLAAAARHPLSLDPAATWTALALLLAFGIFLFGLSSALDDSMITRVVRAIVGVGLVAAVAALIQRAAGVTEIYGFWKPIEAAAKPYGPFVNRNHYAGWVLMALPLALGHFIGRLTQLADSLRHRPRPVFACFSSPLAGELLLTAVALVLIALSGLLSMSRSGILCLAIGMTMFGLVALRKPGSRSWRAIVIAYLVVLTVGAAWGIGLNGLESRLDEFGSHGFGDRAVVWSDGLKVARAYPLAGTGLNSFGTSMLFYQTTRTDVHFDAAHNDYLQLAAEGGILLALPAVAFIVLIASTIRRRFVDAHESTAARWTRIGATIGLLMIAVQEMGEFSLQMPGNAALFCVLAAIALHPRR